VERNDGEWDHNRLQMLLGRYLSNREAEWGIVVVTEQRVPVKTGRFRVPDFLAVTTPAAATAIVHEPPLLSIEILSRDDRMQDMQERIDDYPGFGVACVWILNPPARHGCLYSSESMREAKDGFLRAAGTAISVPLAEPE
jgi:Uma2 family endonuclease